MRIMSHALWGWEQASCHTSVPLDLGKWGSSKWSYGLLCLAVEKEVLPPPPTQPLEQYQEPPHDQQPLLLNAG